VTRFAWGAATDTGRVRSANEDALLTVDGLFAVADGMGGHKAGEVASHLAVETLKDEFTSAGTDELVGAVERANEVLVERSSADEELTGMGTTICAMALVDVDDRDVIAVVNVGDSRLYLLSDGVLAQVTEDHSLVATLERQGRISSDEAAVHPQRNILTRALGIDERVVVDSWEILPVVGDRYLICSDGLFNEIDDNRVAAVLRRLAEPAEAAKELVRLANEAGGRDNITCVVVDVVDDHGRDPEATASSPRVTAHSGGSVPGEVPEGGPAEGLSSTPTDASLPPPPAGAGGSADDDQHPPPRGLRRRLLTWRVGAFALAFVAIVVVAVGGIVWTGNSSYYVGVSGEDVAIYKGKPGGVLWFQPELAETTDVAFDDVPPAYVDAVRSGYEVPSLEAAKRYVDRLRDQIDATTTTTTTSTTTTTLLPVPDPAPPVTVG